MIYFEFENELKFNNPGGLVSAFDVHLYLTFLHLVWILPSVLIQLIFHSPLYIYISRGVRL